MKKISVIASIFTAVVAANPAFADATDHSPVAEHEAATQVDRRPNKLSNQFESRSRSHGTIALARPNVVSLELFGRAGYYSLNFDRAINDVVSLGAGFSYARLNAHQISEATGLAVPVYANVYLMRDSHRPFVSAAADFFMIAKTHPETQADAQSYAATSMVVGAGYEYRHVDGFVFRAAPYLAFLDQVKLSLGVSFGGSF